MAVELNQLMEHVKQMDITLLAGEKSMTQPVSWVHMVETKEATDFLEGGEIAFSTGIGLCNGLTILELVTDIWKNKATGVVINIGPFIESVPKEVIDFCKEHEFPLFLVPWKIHIAEIMRIFCYEITKSDQVHLETAAAFKNAIFFPKQAELYVIPLTQKGFQMNWAYYVCALKVKNSDEKFVSTNRLEQLVHGLDRSIRHHQNINYAIFHYENQILLVLGDYNESSYKQLMDDIIAYLNQCLSKEETFYFGIGKCTKSIRCLNKSYKQALSIQSLQESHQIPKDMISYSNMGIYKLLMGIEDKDILEEYYEKTIAPLDEYDKKHGSDLTAVLKSYLAHDGSVKETAEELFVHRNTINYKLGKISEILDTNLSRLDTRLQLSLGLMLSEFIA